MDIKKTKVVQDFNKVFHLIDVNTGKTLATVHGSLNDSVKTITEFFNK